MDSLIFHNDRQIALRDAQLSPGQVGLLTGWGVFTTLRIYEGIPFAFERHWARMERDAARLAVPICYGSAAVQKAIIELVRANGRPECMARVSFVRNSGGVWAEPGDRPTTDLLIFTHELVAWPSAHRLKLVPEGIYAGGNYAGAKMLSWVTHAAVLEKAHAEGYDDALLGNEKGEIAECTSANVFLVRNGRVLTPPLHSGCLAGITREILLEIAARAGVPLEERDLTSKDLDSADEVFISSTTREVAAVSAIDPKWKYPASGATTQKLEAAFQNYVREYFGSPRRAN